MIGNLDTAYAVLTRRKDFVKPDVMYKQLNVLTPNLNTVEAES